MNISDTQQEIEAKVSDRRERVAEMLSHVGAFSKLTERDHQRLLVAAREFEYEIFARKERDFVEGVVRPLKDAGSIGTSPAPRTPRSVRSAQGPLHVLPVSSGSWELSTSWSAGFPSLPQHTDTIPAGNWHASSAQAIASPGESSIHLGIGVGNDGYYEYPANYDGVAPLTASRASATLYLCTEQPFGGEGTSRTRTFRLTVSVDVSAEVDEVELPEWLYANDPGTLVAVMGNANLSMGIAGALAPEAATRFYSSASLKRQDDTVYSHHHETQFRMTTGVIVPASSSDAIFATLGVELLALKWVPEGQDGFAALNFSDLGTDKLLPGQPIRVSSPIFTLEPTDTPPFEL